MALRDPGAPRRNPLFAVDEHADTGPDPASATDDGWDDWADDPIFGGSDDPLLGAPGSTVGPLVAALTEAGPEAAEHLVNAAHELTLAIKVVVDAFERSLAEQRAAFAAEHAGDPAGRGDAEFDLRSDTDRSAEPREPQPGGRVAPPGVQNIDLE